MTMRLGNGDLLSVPWPNVEWWDDLSKEEKIAEYNSIHSPLTISPEFIEILDGRQIPAEPEENLDQLMDIKRYLSKRDDEARYCKRYGFKQTSTYYCLLPQLARRYIYLSERISEEKTLEHQINHMNNDNKDKMKRMQDLKDLQANTDQLCMAWDSVQWLT